MQRISIVDFGTGNLRSVSKALERVSENAEVVVTHDAAVVADSDRVVLPGQGAIGVWMRALADPALNKVVREVLKSRPVLGICLGLQALYERSSEDGGAEGLGVLTGRVVHFTESSADAIKRDGLKVPHMGWNNVRQATDHPLWRGIDDNTRFYFVHSYHACETRPDQVTGRTTFGVDFTCAAATGNVFAVQFHPEKSAKSGLQLLSNFVAWDGVA